MKSNRLTRTIAGVLVSSMLFGLVMEPVSAAGGSDAAAEPVQIAEEAEPAGVENLETENPNTENPDQGNPDTGNSGEATEPETPVEPAEPEIPAEPEAVQEFKAAAESPHAVKLEWKASEQATGYEIYRKASGQEYTKIEAVLDRDATSYVDKDLAEGTQYFYKMRACVEYEGGVVYGKETEEVECVTGISGTTISGKALGLGMINLSWKKAAGVSGYQVQNMTTSKTSTISGNTVTAYTFTGLKNSTKYKFRIRAYKNVNGTTVYSAYSPAVTVKTAASVTGTVNTSRLNVRKSASTSSKSLKMLKKGTKVAVTGASGSWYKISITINKKKQTAYVSKTYITLSSVTDSGLAKPVLQGKASSLGKMKLTWKQVSGASGYVLQRYDSSKKAYKTIKTITSGSTVSYTDTNLNTSTTYKYRIRAYRTTSVTKGYGAYSSVISAKTSGSVTGKINTSSTYVRASASSSGKWLKTVKKGNTLTVTGLSGSWYRVSVTISGKKKTGYVLKKYVTLQTGSSSSGGSTSKPAPKGGWKKISGKWYYCNEKGEVNVVIKAQKDFLGTCKGKIIDELKAHEKDSFYLGTPLTGLNTATLNYHQIGYPNGAPRSDGFSGMNCTGFVACVTRRCGADLAPITSQGLRGSYYNACNWWRYLKKNAKYYRYTSVSQLLAAGKAEKGDIIYMEPNWSWPGADCHIGIFWGDSPSQNRCWHSVYPKNQISTIHSGTRVQYYYLIKTN